MRRAPASTVRRLMMAAVALLTAGVVTWGPATPGFTVSPSGSGGPAAGPVQRSERPAAAQASPSPSPGVPASLEWFYNPFGDPWARKGPPNASIPVALTSGCHRYEPKRSSGAPDPAELRFVAKSNARLVFEECAELQDISDGRGAARLRPFTTALRTWDPSVRFVGYFAGSAAPTGNLTEPSPFGDGEHLGLRYIDAQQESWFVHQKGMPPTREYRVKHPSGVPSQLRFGDLLDLTNPDLRAFLARELVRSMEFHQVGGVMVDHCGDLPQATNLIPNNVVPDEIVARWADGCVAFLAAIKQADPSKLVFAIGYPSLSGAGQPDAEAREFDWFRRRLEVVDGLLWEDPIGSVRHPPIEIQANLDRLAARIQYARERGKYLGIFVNTNIAGQSTFATTSTAQQRAFARYYLAAYLTVMDGPLAPLIPYTPVASSDQFHSAAFFAEWDLDVGRPTGTRHLLGTGVYRRNFERAQVYLNGGDGPLTVTLEDGSFVTPDGVPVRTYTLPPKSGMVFMLASATPACSPRPPVQLSTRPLAGGGLEVEIRPGHGELVRIDLERTPNTLVSVQGDPATGGERSVTLPRGTTRSMLTLQRANPGGGVFAQFVVVDSCGEWPTFAGRGTGR